MLVVLLHGAYTSPWHLHRLVAVLEAEGVEVVVPDLPGDDPNAGLEQYAAAVEGALPDGSEPPVIVGSSLGAVTACVVAARRPVRALVTVCGVIPAPGRPVADDTPEMTQPAYWEGVDRGPDGSTTFRRDAAIELVFHESEPELAREAASLLRPQAALPYTEPCPFERLPDVPRRGIVAPADRLLRPEWLTTAVRERLGVEPTDLHGDHAPALSRPQRLVELVLATVS